MVQIHSADDKPTEKPYYMVQRRPLKVGMQKKSNLLETWKVVCWITDGLPEQSWENFCKRRWSNGWYRIYRVDEGKPWTHITSFCIQEPSG